MKRIAKFHKVSFEQFKEGWIDTFGAVSYTHLDVYKRQVLGIRIRELLRLH